MEYCLTTEALCKTYRQGKALHNVTTVSYTHLTLPTIA